jgi:hypothetical protein
MMDKEIEKETTVLHKPKSLNSNLFVENCGKIIMN